MSVHLEKETTPVRESIQEMYSVSSLPPSTEHNRALSKALGISSLTPIIISMVPL